MFFSNGPGDPEVADQQVAFSGLYWRPASRTSASASAISSSAGRSASAPSSWGTGTAASTSRDGPHHCKVEVTAHNHGFAVAAAPGERHETPYGIAEVSHICLNDDVVEGSQLTDPDGRLLAFSVQYHPEAAAGPHDASYFFDRFVDLMALLDRPRAQARAGA